MSKLMAAVLTTGSLALMSFSPAQATNKFVDALNPEPTFPTQTEKNMQISKSDNEIQVALVEVCDYYRLRDGSIYYECYYVY